MHVVHRRPSWLHVRLSVYLSTANKIASSHVNTSKSASHTVSTLPSTQSTATFEIFTTTKSKRKIIIFDCKKTRTTNKCGDETARKWIFGQLFSAECRPRTRNTGSKWSQNVGFDSITEIYFESNDLKVKSTCCGYSVYTRLWRFYRERMCRLTVEVSTTAATFLTNALRLLPNLKGIIEHAWLGLNTPSLAITTSILLKKERNYNVTAVDKI